MSTSTGPACPTCRTELRAGSKFCVACGNPVSVASPPTAHSGAGHCEECGAALSIGQQFCSSCGTRIAEESLESSLPATADIVLEALQEILTPDGVLVLVERPSSKRARRCEVTVDTNTRLSAVDRQRFVPLLEEALAWDGYLCGAVRVGDVNDAHCVWHVLDADLFPLSADHAESLLFYVEGLRPDYWSDDEEVIAAPTLVLDSARGSGA
jgi:hypothetical protein